MTLSEKGATAVGDSESIHLLLGASRLTYSRVWVQISRRSVVDILYRLQYSSRRSSKSEATGLADRVKGRCLPALLAIATVGRSLGPWLYLVISNCGLQDRQTRTKVEDPRRRTQGGRFQAILFQPTHDLCRHGGVSEGWK